MARVTRTDEQQSQYQGNRATGCACAYTMFAVPQEPRQARARQRSVQGMYNVDVFESSTGVRHERFFCHRGLTGSFPINITEAPAYTPRRKANLAMRALHTVGRFIRGFMRHMMPRIQFGIGINLFRVNGA